MIILLLHFECMNILYQKCEYIVCTNSYVDYKDLIILLESHLFFKSDNGFSCVPSISCLDLVASFVVCIFHCELFLFGRVCHPFVSFFYLEAVDSFVLLTVLLSLGGTI
jgi:hypothetical protein